VAYALGEHGKPYLSDGGPRFSAARGGDTALYALCESAEVGVDIEPVRVDVDLAGMARRFFSPAEQAALRAIPAAGEAAAVHACWTRKEAYGKAVGTGLRFPLTEIEVWAGDDTEVRHGEVVVQAVAIDGGLAAAVAVWAPRVSSVSTICPPRVMMGRNWAE
jgi:4'-phosphopantetheinyl transferase